MGDADCQIASCQLRCPWPHIESHPIVHTGVARKEHDQHALGPVRADGVSCIGGGVFCLECLTTSQISTGRVATWPIKWASGTWYTEPVRRPRGSDTTMGSSLLIRVEASLDIGAPVSQKCGTHSSQPCWLILTCPMHGIARAILPADVFQSPNPYRFFHATPTPAAHATCKFLVNDQATQFLLGNAKRRRCC